MKTHKYFTCIFFVNLFIRNENTKKIQAKKTIKDPLKNVLQILLLILINAKNIQILISVFKRRK